MRRNDGRPPVRLCEGWATGQSPDGRWALVGLGTEGYAGRNTEFRLVPTGAGEPRTLARGPIAEHYGGAFTPDGKHAIVFGAQAGKPARLWVQELPAGQPTPFGPDSTQAGPVFTPDGHWFAMLTMGPRAAWLLYPIDGGQPRPIPCVNVNETLVQWSDDGRWLYIMGPEGQSPIQITRIDTRTGHRQPWLHLAPTDMAGVAGTHFNGLTPNGRYYDYCYNRSLSDLYVVTGVK
jgi:hypothetical protein